MIRGDLSKRLVHLTRGETLDDAARSFQSILKEKVLRGSNGHIRGGFNCVCFCEAPLGVLVHAFSAMRYKPFGVMVSKEWLFKQGGRPVIYQSDEEYDLLPEELKFRHVRYEPHRGVDYSWEREWRIRTAALQLDPAETTLIVPTRHWEQRLQEEHIQHVTIMAQFLGSAVPSPMPWHFIALEDLGVEGFEAI